MEERIARQAIENRQPIPGRRHPGCPLHAAAHAQDSTHHSNLLNAKNQAWNEQEPGRVEAYNQRVREENENPTKQKPLRQFRPRPMVTTEESKAPFGNDHPYRYYGSTWFFVQAGTGFGEAMVQLLERR